MQVESKNSVMTLIKNVSELNKNLRHESSITLTKSEYVKLTQELWNIDEFLKAKYFLYSDMPQIYSLFGVKIEVV